MFTFLIFAAILLLIEAGWSSFLFVKSMNQDRLALSAASLSVLLAAAFFAALAIGLAVDVLDEERDAEQKQLQQPISRSPSRGELERLRDEGYAPPAAKPVNNGAGCPRRRGPRPKVR